LELFLSFFIGYIIGTCQWWEGGWQKLSICCNG